MHVADWLGRLPNEMRHPRKHRRSGSLSDISSLIGRDGDELPSENWPLGVPYAGAVGNPYYQMSQQTNPYGTCFPNFGDENTTFAGKDKRKYDKSLLGRIFSRVKPRRKPEDLPITNPAGGTSNIPLHSSPPPPPPPHLGGQHEWFWYSGGLQQPPSPPRTKLASRHSNHHSNSKNSNNNNAEGTFSSNNNSNKRRSRSRDCEPAAVDNGVVANDCRRHRKKTGGGGGMRASRSHQERLSGPCMSPTATYDSGFNSSRTVEDPTTTVDYQEGPSKAAMLTNRRVATAALETGSLDRLQSGHRRRRWSLHTETLTVGVMQHTPPLLGPGASLTTEKPSGHEQSGLAPLAEAASNQELSLTASSGQLPS